MRGKRAAVGFGHFIGIAVVGGQQHGAAHLVKRRYNAAHTGIHGLNRFYRSVKHAGVAHHVAVGKV
ncbi:hypothetical protein SDC9_137967 [bioreactor metagenome]|uniref:Uncharacterized protein n=1 Tax=bioreactor metagenome TaxID=1076179 RepID=A0A645DN11_9ZZZZ